MSEKVKEYMTAPEGSGIIILDQFKEATDENIIRVAFDLNFVTKDARKARKYLENTAKIKFE